MAEQIAANDWLCWANIDVSGVTNNAPMEWTQEVKEFVCWKSTTFTEADPLSRKRLVGTQNASMSVSGYTDFAINNAAGTASLGVNDIVLTRGYGRALGSKVHLLVGVQGAFQIGGPIGEVHNFSGDLSISNSILVPGMLFEFGSKTSTANGTSQAIGAVSATQKLYLHAHVIAVTGTNPTLNVIYETSALGTYADAVTRHTFAQFTGINHERAVVDGPITDVNGRFGWTIGGTDTPTFLVRFAAGIK